MSKFIWRLLISIVIFISGLLVGNIFAPRQILQEKDFVGIVKVQTSLDLEKEDNFVTLSQSQSIEEVYFAFLRQYYQKAKIEYEQQLINITRNPQDQKDFIKAQKSYLALVNYIEQNYPLTPKEQLPPVPDNTIQPTEEQEIIPEEPKQNELPPVEQTEEILPEQTKQEQIEPEIALTPQATQTTQIEN